MSSAGSKGAEGPAGPLVNENFVTLFKSDFNDYLEEIERLRQQNAELVEALQAYKCDCHPNCWEDCEPYECDCGVNYCGANANRAIAKATGGE